MRQQSLKTKLILLFLFIIFVVAIAVSFSICTKKPPHKEITYAATYSANENGYISGEKNQDIKQWKDATSVTAVPNDGYLFAGWSDNVLVPTRTDTHFTESIEVSATFISKFKTLKYDYNGATANNTVTSVTLDYDNLLNTNFVVPTKTNYEFKGWYLDKEFTRRVTDNKGTYFLGKSIYYCDADTIYAKWEDREGIVYPILLIFAPEVDANLKVKDTKTVNISYNMSIPELKVCYSVATILSTYLNEAFKGSVYFEFDSYYTNTPINEYSFSNCYGITYGKISDILYPPCIPEVVPQLKKYKSVITTANFSGPSPYINEIKVNLAGIKYALVNLPSNYNINSPFKGIDFDLNNNIIHSYLHELIHTIENITSLSVFESHKYEVYYSALVQNYYEEIEALKLYFLNQGDYYGETVGIPFDYWEGKYDVESFYVTTLLENTGAFIEAGYIGYNNKQYTNIGITVPYGSSLTVEAIPQKGYKFLKWSDGITTPIRTDTNITSLNNIIAIFVKDE